MEIVDTALKCKSLVSTSALWHPRIINEHGSVLLDNTTFWSQLALESGKTIGVVSRIEETLKASENDSLNIAVIGDSGSGKSALINALRGIGHEEKDSASTGVVETTMMDTPYGHPKYSNVKFWDLSGIGTPYFHPETYLNQVHFDRYDFFIILSVSRFTANDVKLVQEIRKRDKKFYFIRTKVDADLDKERKAKPQSFSKVSVLQKIRDDCLQTLYNLGLSEVPVFLVSNFDLFGYDFPKLQEELLRGLSAHKHYMFLLVLLTISEAAIDRKAAALQERVWEVALWTGSWAMIPFAGYFINDKNDLDKCLKQYRNDFGLDDASLCHVAQKLKRPVKEIRAIIKSLDLLAKGESNMEKLIEGLYSTLGTPLGAVFHFTKSYRYNKAFIDTVAADAKRLLQEILCHHF